MKLRYEEMLPHEYEAARAAAPIAYLPWGAHEWHGTHNALGLDSLKAHHLCLELAKKTGGVVFPPVYCGFMTMKPHGGFGMTLEFGVELVKENARQYLAQLADEKFKVIVLLMGHYGSDHVKALKGVTAEFNAAHPNLRVLAIADYEATRGFAADHAGKNETSQMLYFRPELVDLVRLPEGEVDWKKDGVSPPNPRHHASKEYGRQIVEAFVRELVPKIGALLKEVL